MDSIRFGIITVSDSCYNEGKTDISGLKFMALLKDTYSTKKTVCKVMVPDDIPMIKEAILQFYEEECDVIFTTGGTGVSPRDVTPEATKSVIDKEIPGLACAMMVKCLAVTEYAMLSRAVCGIKEKTLIINLPGSLKAVVEHFDIIKNIIPHLVALIKDEKQLIENIHQFLQKEVKHESLVQFTPSKVKINTIARRNRTSPYPMVEVSEAHNIIQSICVQDSDNDVVDIKDVLGRVLGEDIRSLDSVPPYPSSVKDGYAVRSVDGIGKRTVIDGIAAGDAPTNYELKEGQCIRISTGAAVPPGADAVVQVEDTELLLASLDQTKELEIAIKVAPTVGQDIRSVGSDIDAYAVIMKKGIVLNAAEVGVLAAVGKTSIKVFKRPKVCVISTGNELQDLYTTLEYGRIRDSNKITLLSILKQYGYDGEDFGIVKDEPNAMKNKFEEAFSKCDLIITTGGVSMGEYDVIKRVLVEDFNAKIHFGRVNMKPGKPTTFATCFYNGQVKMVFGLPGNPVSATVTCLLFVIYTLRYCENRQQLLFPLVTVETKFTPKLDPERPEYHRVKLVYEGSIIKAYSTGNQISSRLNSFVEADGLLILPPQTILTMVDEIKNTSDQGDDELHTVKPLHISSTTNSGCPLSAPNIFASSNQPGPSTAKTTKFGPSIFQNTKPDTFSFNFSKRSSGKRNIYPCYLLNRY